MHLVEVVKSHHDLLYLTASSHLYIHFLCPLLTLLLLSLLPSLPHSPLSFVLFSHSLFILLPS